MVINTQIISLRDATHVDFLVVLLRSGLGLPDLVE